MKEGVPPNEFLVLLECPTALGLHGFERLQTVEVAIGKRLVGERPEMFGWLQFRRVGGKEEEMEALWYLHRLPGMPAGAIQHQEDPFGETSVHLPGEGGQDVGKEVRCHRGEQPPHRLPGTRPDEATDIQPLVALLDGGDGPLALRCPDPSNEREQADPVFIGGPEFDTRRRMRLLDGNNLSGQIFF